VSSGLTSALRSQRPASPILRGMKLFARGVFAALAITGGVIGQKVPWRIDVNGFG